MLPGIAALLEGLRGREDVRIGLLTGNIRAGAKAKLGHFGLYEYFAFGGFGDDHFDRDDVAREALAAVHLHCNGAAHADRIWVIGDTPLDVQCSSDRSAERWPWRQVGTLSRNSRHANRTYYSPTWRTLRLCWND